MTTWLGSAARWVCLILALAIMAGCAETPKTVRPEMGPQAAPGTVSGNNYLNQQLGLYWMAPAGYKAQPPQADPGLLMTWTAPRGRLAARLWLATGEPSGGPDQASARFAAAQGWRAVDGRSVTWQGRPCWDGAYQAGDQKVRARFLHHPGGLLVVAVLAPSASAEELKPEAVTVMENLRVLPMADVLHTVKYGGESLDLVALWYTGRAENWRRLRDHNRIKVPGLTPGQEVLIPRELVWRLDPLPGWMLRMARPAAPAKAATGRVPAKATEPAAEDPGEGIVDLELTPTGPK